MENFRLLPTSEHAVIALTMLLSHLAIFIYALFKRNASSKMLRRLLLTYLLIAIIWNFSTLRQIFGSLPKIAQSAYIFPLIPLAIVSWLYTLVFLRQKRSLWHVFTLASVTLIATLVMQFAPYPFPKINIPFSGRILDSVSLIFWITVFIGGLIFGHALWLTKEAKNASYSPRYKNRNQFLRIALSFILIGLSLYFSTLTPMQNIGLVIHWIGSLFLVYLTFNQQLPDINTALKTMAGWGIISIIAIAVYFSIITIFQKWTLFNPVQTAIFTSIILVFLYPLLEQSIQKILRKVLFAHQYNSAKIIKSYLHATNSILLLKDLAAVSLTFIAANLNISHGAFFLIEAEDSTSYRLNIVSNLNGDLPPKIILLKNSLLMRRLMDENLPVAQYFLDTSRDSNLIDRKIARQMRQLGFEQYFPIKRNAMPVGILALGQFSTGRDYTLQDIDLFSTLAEQSAIALENARLFDDIRQNLQEITRVNNLMDNIFSSIHSGVITIDNHDNITVINDAAYRILNLPRTLKAGQSINKIFDYLEHSALPALFRDIKSTQRNYQSYEIVQSVPKRGSVNLSIDLSSIKNVHKNTTGLVLVINDFTETRRLKVVQNLFRKYLSPAVVDRLPDDPTELKLGGKRQEVTILFADIRGFSTFSEYRDPEDLITILNKYLSLAADAILAYEGTLDKFVGDAVMAVFNAPLQQDNHPQRAVRAAVEMQRSINAYHEQMVDDDVPLLSFGVGIHVGDAVIGNVGTQSRMDYTAIGDAVNLAKRLQENTPAGKILLSHAAYQCVKDIVNAVPFKLLTVKGRETSEQTYELLNLL